MESMLDVLVPRLEIEKWKLTEKRKKSERMKKTKGRKKRDREFPKWEKMG